VSVIGDMSEREWHPGDHSEEEWFGIAVSLRDKKRALEAELEAAREREKALRHQLGVLRTITAHELETGGAPGEEG
jgi:hypothetical protein